VIPAHDEATVIGRCLSPLMSGATPDELEIIVVGNGCRGDSADVARVHGPHATVVEIRSASKAAALNTGARLATRFPRFYLDADVELTGSAVRQLAHPLAEGRFGYAAPEARFVARHRTPAVQAYWTVWTFVARARNEPSGTGVYGLSAGGRRRFTEFPDLIADDQFVVQQFHPQERLACATVATTVHPPLTLGELLRTRVRVYRGNQQLAHSGLARYPAARGAVPALLTLSRVPQHLPAVAVYVAVNLLARVGAGIPHDDAWTRDRRSRCAPAETLQTA